MEILQTYQREQRPITEVYSQVTRLFEGAPDLLDDFKQFLPDTSAQQQPGAPIAGGARSMPPVGSFAPPPSTAPPEEETSFAYDGTHYNGIQSPSYQSTHHFMSF